jgi:hypothetical protein
VCYSKIRENFYLLFGKLTQSAAFFVFVFECCCLLTGPGPAAQLGFGQAPQAPKLQKLRDVFCDEWERALLHCACLLFLLSPP